MDRVGARENGSKMSQNFYGRRSFAFVILTTWIQLESSSWVIPLLAFAIHKERYADSRIYFYSSVSWMCVLNAIAAHHT